jgi:putative phosphoribosyl transferase
MFQDRTDAAKQLAIALEQYSGRDTVVLGIPRGGVEIAYHVAKHLNAVFSFVVIRKLGYPDNPEAAFGAVAEDGSIYLSKGATRALTDEEINEVISAERIEITRRIRILRKGKSLPELTGKTVIIVDDGIATGATIFSAISLCRKRNPLQLVVAAPVAGAGMKHHLQGQADDVVILETPPFFYAVGQGYENFENLTDDQTAAFIESWGKE